MLLPSLRELSGNAFDNLEEGCAARFAQTILPFSSPAYTAGPKRYQLDDLLDFGPGKRRILGL